MDAINPTASMGLSQCGGKCTGVSFVDVISLKVCPRCHINRHRVFKNLAAGGKTSVD